MSVVREDKEGLYLVINGAKRRPGELLGYSIGYHMGPLDLKAGDRVKCRFVDGTPLCCITDGQGRKTYWSDEDELRRQMPVSTGKPPAAIHPMRILKL